MAKPVRKAPAKKTQSAKSAPKKMAKVVSHADFMKRMLAKKEADRLAKQEQNQNSQFNHKMENQAGAPTEAHNRFNGPRRKAAV